MSVGCSTTQSWSGARDGSAQIPQISSMVKKPQREQGRTVCRVARSPARYFPADRHAPAPSRGDAFGGTRSNAGHLPQLRDQAPGSPTGTPFSSRPAAPYSSSGVLVETATRAARAGGDIVAAGDPPHLRDRAHFEIANRLRPSAFPGKGPRHSRTRSRRAICSRVASSASCQRLVNFVTLAHVDAAQEIDRARDDCLAGQFKGARSEQDTRAIKAIRYAEAAGQLHRLSGREHAPLPIIFHGRHDHGAGADPAWTPMLAGSSDPCRRLVGIRKRLESARARCASLFPHDAYRSRENQRSATIPLPRPIRYRRRPCRNDSVAWARNFSVISANAAGSTFLREIVLVRDVANDRRHFEALALRFRKGDRRLTRAARGLAETVRGRDRRAIAAAAAGIMTPA